MKTVATRRFPVLPDGAHQAAGSFDRKSRWYPDDKYRVPRSFEVRGPTAARPYSYLRHFYSRRYSRLLLAARPDLWAELAGKDPDSLRVAGLSILAQEVHDEAE